MKSFYSQRVTNWLLAGILLVLILDVWMRTERNAIADTFYLDYCITQNIKDAPKNFLHVVNHPAVGAKN